MREIGGYFGLELNKHSNPEFHNSLVSVNSCRNSLALLVKYKKIKKIYIPFYICNVIVEVLKASLVQIEFFEIDEKLEIKELPKDENIFLLYVNYFGIKDKYIEKLSKLNINLIIDNAQSYYSMPLPNIDTIYSPRKFFGVPDGGFLNTMEEIRIESYKKDISNGRFSHLLKRIELSASDGFEDFKRNSLELKNAPIKQMSELTKCLIEQLDHQRIKMTRLNNFKFLHRSLKSINRIQIDLKNCSIPMVYPFLPNEGGSEKKKHLINNKVFIATYWPGLKDLVNVEKDMVENLIPLPMDQRYGIRDMKIIIHLLKDD